MEKSKYSDKENINETYVKKNFLVENPDLLV